MKTTLLAVCLVALLTAPLSAQVADTTVTMDSTAPAPSPAMTDTTGTAPAASPAMDATQPVTPPAQITQPAPAPQQPAPAPSQQAAPPPQKKSGPKKTYFGGTVGVTFGDYFRINVAPLIGYKLIPMVSVGASFQYEYIENKRYEPKVTASNYGGSVFTRARLNPKVYAHGELSYMSYKWGASDRDWVPFLWLGGGVVQPLARGTSVYAQVLVDVLQDSKSPYEDWNPFFSVGVVAGF